MAGIISQENGKKGGRPKGSVSEATKAKLEGRAYIREQVEKHLENIVSVAIADATNGDRYARDWLSDNGWGKPKTTIAGDTDNPMSFIIQSFGADDRVNDNDTA